MLGSGKDGISPLINGTTPPASFSKHPPFSLHLSAPLLLEDVCLPLMRALPSSPSSLSGPGPSVHFPAV